MRIPRSLYDGLVAHALQDAPDECCGMVATDAGGAALKVFRTTNIHHSPLRYEIDPREQFRTLEEIEGSGWELGAIYHSHTKSPPYPSQTDINLARNWPDPLYVIIGVAGAEPEVRAFSIVNEEVSEVEISVEE